jgi:hypothetical protein
MPDEIEVLGRVVPPSLSQGIVEYEEGLLRNQAWVQENPENAAMLRRTLDEAKAATGYQGTPVDQRTPAQQLHDRQFSVSFGPSGEVAMPDHLAGSIQRELTLGQTPDPEIVAKQLVASGMNPDAVLTDARYALERAKSAVAVEKLGPHALAQLAVWGQHLKRHGESRPQ